MRRKGSQLRWPMRCAFSIFHFPSIFHLRSPKNVEKAAISLGDKTGLGTAQQPVAATAAEVHVIWHLLNSRSL